MSANIVKVSNKIERGLNVQTKIIPFSFMPEKLYLMFSFYTNDI